MPNIDEALVERLAKTLYDCPAHHEDGFEIAPALIFEEAGEDAKQHYRSEGRKLLTALSETHVIVPRPLMRRIDDSLCAMCMSRNGCDGCEILQIQRDLADCLAEEVSPRA